MIRNIKRVTLVLIPALIIGIYLGRYFNSAYDDVSRKPLVQLKDLKILKEIQFISGKEDSVHNIHSVVNLETSPLLIYNSNQILPVFVWQ